MALTPLDHVRLHEALALADAAIGLSDPNPRVGCVVGDEHGRVLGRGHTQHAGGAHAEVAALADARARGHGVAGATAWVTLEPCAHHGRTPPCCDALVAAGIGRVVVAVGDPFPGVAGRGLDRLRAGGVQVEVADANRPSEAALVRAAREINVGFFSRHERGRPFVRAKVAASLDGRTARSDGASRWITGPEARADGHAWRRRAGAVLTGVGTVLADDPRLDVREVAAARQPLRVVLDPALRLPPGARILAPPGAALVVTAGREGADAKRALQARGAEVLGLPSSGDGRVALPALMAELARREVNELHVEAGATLLGAFQAADLVDEWLVYVAPRWVGDGRGMLDGLPPADLALPPGLAFVAVDRVGPDLRLRLRPRG